MLPLSTLLATIDVADRRYWLGRCEGFHVRCGGGCLPQTCDRIWEEVSIPQLKRDAKRFTPEPRCGVNLAKVKFNRCQVGGLYPNR